MKQDTSIRFRIDFADDVNLGPGKISLLEAIEEHGSLSEAARSLDISYRRAWLLLDSLNKSFDKPSTVSSAGGRGGGGAHVTAFGTLLIERYRQLESEISHIGSGCMKDIVPRVVRVVRAAGGGPRVKRTALPKKLRQ